MSKSKCEAFILHLVQFRNLPLTSLWVIFVDTLQAVPGKWMAECESTNDGVSIIYIKGARGLGDIGPHSWSLATSHALIEALINVFI